MSWADKQLKKHKIHKMVENAMNDPRYQKEQKKQLDEATTKAFDSFMVISVAYLHDKQGFGKKVCFRFALAVRNGKGMQKIDLMESD